MSEWTEIYGIVAFAKAVDEGLEIESRYAKNQLDWVLWDDKQAWYPFMEYRARHKQPAMKKVKSLCYRDRDDGDLLWRSDGHNYPKSWQRFPAGDIEGEVEA